MRIMTSLIYPGETAPRITPGFHAAVSLEVPAGTMDYSELRNRVREEARGLYGDDCHHVWIDSNQQHSGNLPNMMGAEMYSLDGRVFAARPWISWENPVHEELGDLSRAVHLDRPPMKCSFRLTTKRRQIPEEEAILHAWLLRSPTDSTASYHMAGVYRARGKWDLARSFYATAVKNGSPKDPRVRQAALDIAHMTRRLGEDPITALLIAAEMGHPSAWIELAQYLLDNDCPSLAEAVLLQGRNRHIPPSEINPPAEWEWSKLLEETRYASRP